MSDKKVNSKMLKDLIKEVLEEKRLDEKYVTRDGTPIFDDGEYSSLTQAKKAAKLGSKLSGTEWNTLSNVNKEDDVNGIQPLSLADLQNAAKGNNTQKKAFNKIPQARQSAIVTATTGSDSGKEGAKKTKKSKEDDFKTAFDKLKNKYAWVTTTGTFRVNRMNLNDLRGLFSSLQALYDKYKEESLIARIWRASIVILEDETYDLGNSNDIGGLRNLKQEMLDVSKKYNFASLSVNKQKLFGRAMLGVDQQIKKIEREKRNETIKKSALSQIEPNAANKIKTFPNAVAVFVDLDTKSPEDPKLIYRLDNIDLPTSGTNYLDEEYIWAENGTGPQHFAISAKDAKDPNNLQELFKYAKEMIKRDKVEKNYSLKDVVTQMTKDDPDLSSDFENELKALFDYDELKGLNEDVDKLDVGDFEFLFDNFDQYYKKILKNASTSKEAAEKLQQFRDLIIRFYNDPRVKSEETKTMLSQIMSSSKATGSTRSTLGSTSGYKISSRSASGGTIDFQVIEAFGNSFPSNLTFEERFDLFNKYIADIQGVLSGKKLEESVDQKFSKFIVLDMMQQILYDFEASSAGWVFESFLAFMAFGEAIGAGYGAGDFTIQEKDPKTGEVKSMQGSAKLLQKGATSQNFAEMKKGEVIKYVIGVKSTRKGQEFTPTKQGERTGKLDVYIVDVECTKAGGKAEEITIKWGTGDEVLTLKEDRAKLIVPPGEPAAGVLDLLFLQENDFQDVSSIIVKDIGENLDKAMNQMSSLKANIDNYVLNFSKEDERKIYSDSAIKSYNDLKKTLMPKESEEIFGGSIQESKKITSNFLKKIIQETLKK